MHAVHCFGSGSCQDIITVQDVINVSGHRVGTAEVESALCSNDEVVEAAVVGWVPAPPLNVKVDESHVLFPCGKYTL